ncbi:T9SS type A sorting domain-containing protein [Saprospira sp. CCB-QB6]|uniref:T9SS type A sorting domain-containing protein n=1 Tax=Saprospira sp. CCB-QB6 TaxID=3023936 RepID=UPI00234A2C5E|nr:T9SS type A sorting domain-containing protein [Saprospira sp. CCB-QB6]WCL81438.1 T9SS type A sorting domain-containing protein [Saprospira sp. CCB-QB6]
MKTKLIFLFSLFTFFFLGRNQAQNAFLSGNLYLDADQNCNVSVQDQDLPHIIISLTDSTSGTQYFQKTSSTGYYSFDVPASLYNLEVHFPFEHDYFTLCAHNSSILLQPSQVDTLDLFARVTTSRAIPFVELSTDFIPDCGSARYYVYMANLGNTALFNGNLLLELDGDRMSLDTSSIPLINLGNERYQLNYSYLAPSEDSAFHFTFDVNTNCNDEPGSMHKVRAEFSPQIIDYNIGELALSADCLGDSIQFIARNIGRQSLPAQALIVIEDDVMYSQPNIGTLDSLDADTIIIPTRTRSTYRIQAPQTQNNRLLSSQMSWASLEGCKPDAQGGYNTNFAGQFYQDHAAAHIAYDAQESQAQRTASLSRAFPRGYGSNQYVELFTPLEFQLVYEKQDADTTAVLTLVDSISPWLDPSSFQLGAHNLTGLDWTISGQGILTFNFANYNLYQGDRVFVNYQLYPKASALNQLAYQQYLALEDGQLKQPSTTAIYRTFGQNFIISSYSHELAAPMAPKVKIYPQPARHSVNLELLSAETAPLQFEIYNLQGQLLYQLEGVGPRCQLNLPNLPQGILIYRLRTGQKVIDQGQLSIF